MKTGSLNLTRISNMELISVKRVKLDAEDHSPNFTIVHESD